MGLTKYFVNATHINVYHPDTPTQKRQVTKTLVAVKMVAQHLLSRLPTLMQTCYGPRTTELPHMAEVALLAKKVKNTVHMAFKLQRKSLVMSISWFDTFIL